MADVAFPSENDVNKGASLKILIVEDEPFIADICRKFLQSQGHVVTAASDGQEGIDLYRDGIEFDDPFELVITDFRMPRKDGAQLIREILSIDPNQRIILTTAYGAEYAQLGIPQDKVPVLTKPFSFDDLGRLIEKQAAAMD